LTCDAPANDMPAIIAGIHGHPIEDVTVRDVSMVQKGGGAAATATIVPPEQEREYPEPSFLGPLPAQGLLVRHARNVTFHRVEIASIRADERPFIWLGDVEGADFSGLTLSPRRGVPALHVRRTGKLRISASAGLPDTSLDLVNEGQFP
jgi:hypothetical protein